MPTGKAIARLPLLLVLWLAAATATAQPQAHTYEPTRATDPYQEAGLYREVVRIPLAPGERVHLAYAFGESTPVATALRAPRLAPNGRYPEQPAELGPVVTEAGQRYQLLYRYGGQLTETGELLTYTWVEYGLERTPEPTSTPTLAAAQAHTAKSGQPIATSVLATGTWYQLRIAATGVYRIDAGLLQTLGIDPASVSPTELRLYGFNTGLLSQANSAARPNGLQPLAVRRQGNLTAWDGTTQVYFFAQGPHAWRYDSLNQSLYHEQHLYDDFTYVYLSFNGGSPSPAISDSVQTTSGAPVGTVYLATYTEEDALNLTRSGRQWFSLPLQNGANTYALQLPSSSIPATAELRVRAAARGGSTSTVGLSVNGTNLGVFGIASVNLTSTISEFARQISPALSGLPAASGTYTVSVDFTPGTSGTGWLDYIEIVAGYPSLALNQPGALYAAPEATPALRQTTLATGGLQLWEVTHPTRPRTLTLSGSSLTFRTDTLRTFWAFDPAATPLPEAVGPVANQNLHGLPAADYLIVTDPAFTAAAERLADYHRSENGLSVHVVTDAAIYHEFSAGSRDASALRDFVRMFYLRSQADPGFVPPKYLLLVGDASYDNLGRTESPSRVVTYQSRHSLRRLSSYVSDDFFGFLDEDEGFWGEQSFLYPYDNRIDLHFLDIGVGRLPVSTPEQANQLVDKLIRYQRGELDPGTWQTRALLLGDWRQNEFQLHTRQADELADTLQAKNACLGLEKIYFDEFPADFAGSRVFFPEARAEALRQLERGALMVNYTGHGSEVTLSNSTIFTSADGAALANAGKPAFWLTATCEFGRHDNPELTSGVETLLLRPSGGAIGALTSVRLVYSSPNFLLNRNWHRFSANLDSLGRLRALGDIFRLAKNETYPQGLAIINTRNFSLLGDPAMRLQYPRNRVALTEINGQPVGSDTLRALQSVTLSGEIQTADGNRQTGFSGELDVVLFDKSQPFTTQLDGFTFQDFRSVLFSGRVSVTAGQFTVSFVLPLDINYTPGPGNLQLYTSMPGQTAAGCWQEATVCCTDPTGLGDTQPPTIELAVGDSNWVSGSTVGPNPTLIATLADDTGINPSGQGIGRELLATLDGDATNAINLGPFYQGAPDDPRRGTVTYQLQNLAPGPHTLTVRAWDVANNSTTATTTFTVRSAEEAGTFAEARLYPNPYSAGSGSLQLRVNALGDARPLTVTADAIGSDGRRYALLAAPYTTQGYVQTFSVDLQAAAGQLPAGYYTVRITLTDPTTGASEEQLERLLLLQP